MPGWLDSVSAPCRPEELALRRAAELADFVAIYGAAYGARLVETRKARERFEIVVVEVEVDRPQERKADIRKRERIAAVVQDDDGFLTVLALRPDFPFTPHQTAVPQGMPLCLCIDDRPWQEARLTWSPAECLRRIREWLAKAARGELYDPAQPLEPLFYSSGYVLVLPRSSIEHAGAGEALQLVGGVRDDGDPKVIIASPDDQAFKDRKARGKMVIIPLALPEQAMSGIHRLPGTLEALAEALKAFGVDLLAELRSRLAKWVDWKSGEFVSLSAHLGICVFAKVTSSDGSRSSLDARAFFTAATAGEVGVAIGCLLPAADSGVKGTKGYVPAVVPDRSRTGSDIPIEPMDVHLDFDRVLGAEISGRPSPDMRTIVMVGAGAIGSHIALMLAREGAFQWVVVDHDSLLPHNLARHGLPRWYVGAKKAPALAHQIADLLGDQKAGLSITVDCLAPRKTDQQALTDAFSSADIILDTSASIAVERHLSNLQGARARRLSAFFNPEGSAAVLLAEPAHRSMTLRDIEAQYYNAVLIKPELKGHLAAAAGVRYSGSCRTLTSKIPERSAAVLSGLVAGGLAEAIEDDQGGISVWSLQGGGASALRLKLEPPLLQGICGWSVSVDGRVLSFLRAERSDHLPSETGGVLLGIVDFQSRSIHVVHALAAPPDSVETRAGFERGVRGLEGSIAEACKEVMDQIRYVGEWHSHPRGASPMPSTTDIGQMCWLSDGLVSEGCPAVMLIVGDKGETINLAIAAGAEE
jgi:integrative and conjugative element protein (TIGR02256 family)